jgi:serine/threonine protein kinase SCH9
MPQRHGLGIGHTALLNKALFGAATSDRASANRMSSSARHEHRHDDFHDLLGSNSPTPSGVETPRPDLHDKRLPGIVHGYFGQVGRAPSQIAPSWSSQAATIPEHQPNEHNSCMSQKEPGKKGEDRRVSTASLGSMVMVEREQNTVPTPPPEEPQTGFSQSAAGPDASCLPPTPISSAASVVQRDGEVAENGGSLLDNGLASITQALRNFVLPKSTSSVKDRRHQSLPVSSVTRSTVPAAHISNPASSAHSSGAHSPRSPSPSHSKQSPSENLNKSDELTSDAALGLREKSTPPHTPRALSQEDHRRAETRSPLSSTSTNAGDGNTLADKHPRAKDSLPAAHTPRGKLNIKIAEGRNLKASFNPYVVCQFEWNEYVSRGARHDKMDVDEDEQKGPAGQLSSVPIRRTDSDMGKPMAIPMRSRQSSTNGAGEDRGLDKVTDPQWDHEAIL